MQRISAQSNDNYQLARKVLYWVVNSIFPLTLRSLQQALAIENEDTSLDEENIPDGELLVSVCTGLVEVHRGGGIVGLVHFTTQEYFERKGHELFPEAQEDILRTCLTCLSFEEFGNGPRTTRKDMKTRLQKYPFLKYSGKFSVKHKISLQLLDLAMPIHQMFAMLLYKIFVKYSVFLRTMDKDYAYTLLPNSSLLGSPWQAYTK